MPLVVAVSADSIFVGRARRPGGNGKEVPLITMNFAPLLAERLVHEIFPTVTSNNVLVGVEDVGHFQYRVSAFIVVTLGGVVRPLLVPVGSKPPYIFITGNETVLSSSVVTPFLDGLHSKGAFYLGCGYHPMQKDPRLAGDWTFHLTSICYRDADGMLQNMVQKEIDLYS